MLNIIRLIRFPNLLIIALTMYLTRYCLLIEFDGQAVKFVPLTFTLNNVGFGLLVMATLFIAAAGYIINDYCDTKIDAINKPERLIIGVTISRRKAMMAHTILSSIGVLIGFWLAYEIHHLIYGWINVMTALLLWKYSTSFKKNFLIGNVVIALLSGLIPFMVALFEPNAYKELYYFIIAYSSFAFLIALMREIIKDLEDIEGDIIENCRTLPIVLGVNITKTVIIILIAIIIAGVGYVIRMPFFSGNRVFLLYSVFTIQIPLLVMIYFVVKAYTKRRYYVLSTFTKIIMLTGVLSMYVFYYSLNHL